jgi:1,4-alpha-glucan branching enzyme
VVGAQTPAVTPARDTVRLVQFVLLAPRAAQVQLAGDFNGWQGSATPLRRTASGLWAVELPLPPGRYTYTFVVDGSHFTPDPAAPRALVDDFGTPSSVVTVGGGNT